MPDDINSQWELIENYLGNTLTPEEKYKMEQRLAEDPDLRKTIQHLQSIDQRLRRAYLPLFDSGDDALIHSAGRSTPRQRHNKLRIRGRWIAYALVLVMGVTGWYVFLRPMPEPINASRVHNGFVINPYPDTICDTPQKFLDYTRDRLGVSIAADFSTAAALIGWRSTGVLYDSTEFQPLALLAKSPTDEPIVVIFQKTRSPAPTLDDGSSLNLLSRRFGDLTAWEVTPLPDPVILDLLSMP